MQRTPSIVGAAIAASLISAPALASEARVRVVHASPDAPAVDVLVNGSPAFESLAFTGVTDYALLPADTYNVQVVPAGTEKPVVIDADLTVDALTDYTVLAVNTLDSIEPLVLVDDNTLSADNARVRFVHASPNAPAVDIALADGGPVLFSNIVFKGVGDYIDVAPGTYDLEARLAGTSTVVLDIPNVMVTANRVYTAYAIGLVAGDPALGAAISVDAVASTRVRAIHASPDAPTVDVLVDDAPAFEDLSFTGVTGYADLPFGAYNVKVVPANTVDPVVIEADLSLDANLEYSVLAINILDEIEPLVLVDDNNLDLNNTRIRFVHASPNAPAVDIALDGGAVLFSNISFRGVGDYLSVPGGFYDLEVRLAGTSTVVLDLPAIDFMNDTTYTAYAMGLVGDTPPLQAVLSVDASCSPDISGNGAVDFHDILSILSAWGPCDGCPEDVDGDGDVAFGDILETLRRWGECP